MRTFKLIRKIDVTGTSGTGHVANGRVLENGMTIVEFFSLANLADGSKLRIDSKIVYKSPSDAILIHGHNGATILQWNDTGEVLTDREVLGMSETKSVPEIKRITKTGNVLRLIKAA